MFLYQELHHFLSLWRRPGRGQADELGTKGGLLKQKTAVHVAARPPGRSPHHQCFHLQACLRPRDRFWDIPVPKIDSAFDNLLVPQPSWSPSTTQQL
ncbi:hypothetical protein, partial [Thiolapillus sp.]|uniref:hypothetical protein n=1 Tax=Thiolapillus sp. TaxID=2017437 RepID=UPI003AF7958F